ncbi:hypothetical protein ABIE71_002174 [Bradyrhizobium diazoefficiens]
MGNWQHRSVNSITRQTKPACQPLFAIVPDPAQSCLNALKRQRLNILEKILPDLRTLLYYPDAIRRQGFCTHFQETAPQTDASTDVLPTKMKHRQHLDIR